MNIPHIKATSFCLFGRQKEHGVQAAGLGPLMDVAKQFLEKWFALVCLFGLVWLACIVLLCIVYCILYCRNTNPKA